MSYGHIEAGVPLACGGVCTQARQSQGSVCPRNMAFEGPQEAAEPGHTQAPGLTRSRADLTRRPIRTSIDLRRESG